MRALYIKGRPMTVKELIRRVQMRFYLQHREDTRRAIERIAEELARQKCAGEGNRMKSTWSD